MKQLKSIVRKSLVALGVALLFGFFAIFPLLGYHGGADTRVLERDSLGFWIVEAEYDIVFSPFLYPFSWISGKGHSSSIFSFLSVPTYVGYEFRSPAWRSPEELNEEAVIRVLVASVVPSIAFNFFIFLAVGLMEQQLLYLCLFGGIIGFLIGSVLGSVLGLITMIFVLYFVMPELNMFDLIARYF